MLTSSRSFTKHKAVSQLTVGRRTPLEAMRAMQAINAAVRNALFALGFFGTPILCLLVLLAVVLPAGRGVGGLVAASGAALYIALAFVVTFARNIPLNEALAAATSAEQWNALLAPWVSWNHVRTAGSMAAACLLALVVRTQRRSPLVWCPANH
jgi:uncharacterized membrane protein